MLLLSNSVRISLHPDFFRSSVLISKGVDATTVYFWLNFCINSLRKLYKPLLLFARISILSDISLLYLHQFPTIYVNMAMLHIVLTIPSKIYVIYITHSLIIRSFAFLVNIFRADLSSPFSAYTFLHFPLFRSGCQIFFVQKNPLSICADTGTGIINNIKKKSVKQLFPNYFLAAFLRALFLQESELIQAAKRIKSIRFTIYRAPRTERNH